MVQKNSMSKLREVIRVTKTKSYCQGTTCWRCILLALQTIQLGLIEVGNQEKPLEYSPKKKKKEKHFIQI
jgi:hypothetical protein